MTMKCCQGKAVYKQKAQRRAGAAGWGSDRLASPKQCIEEDEDRGHYQEGDEGHDRPSGDRATDEAY